MRICLFTPTFYPKIGGAERDADVLARGLIARGHEVMILAQRQRVDGPMPDLPYPVFWYRRPPAQNLWAELLALSLTRAYRHWRFDVVLAFFGYPNGYAATIARRWLQTPVVVSPRGGDLDPGYHELRKSRVPSLIARGYAEADRILSISQSMTDCIIAAAGPKLPPVDLVYNGIDLAAHDRELREAQASPPSLPVRPPLVLHIGRVTPVKNQALAVEAIARCRAVFERTGTTYAIVGHGADADRVNELIVKHDLGGIVKMLGTRVGLEKAWLFANARFLVSSSVQEGLGNVVLEGVASGLPVIASDIAPHRELIEGTGAGELFRSGDAGDFAQRLARMLEADLSPYRAASLRLRERFTFDRMIDGYENACRTVLADRADASI